jgi:hypothetical protein
MGSNDSENLKKIKRMPGVKMNILVEKNQILTFPMDLPLITKILI